MNPLYELWFWLLIIGIIGLIVAVILFEGYAAKGNGIVSVPNWIWVVFIAAIIVVIISCIIYCYRAYREHQLIACCDKSMVISEVTRSIAPITTEPLILQPLEAPVRVEQVVVEQEPGIAIIDSVTSCAPVPEPVCNNECDVRYMPRKQIGRIY